MSEPIDPPALVAGGAGPRRDAARGTARRPRHPGAGTEPEPDGARRHQHLPARPAGVRRGRAGRPRSARPRPSGPRARGDGGARRVVRPDLGDPPPHRPRRGGAAVGRRTRRHRRRRIVHCGRSRRPGAPRRRDGDRRRHARSAWSPRPATAPTTWRSGWRPAPCWWATTFSAGARRWSRSRRATCWRTSTRCAGCTTSGRRCCIPVTGRRCARTRRPSSTSTSPTAGTARARSGRPCRRSRPRPAQLVAVIYATVDRALWPFAEQSTRAALRKLAADGTVELGADDTARLTP